MPSALPRSESGNASVTMAFAFAVFAGAGVAPLVVSDGLHEPQRDDLLE